MSIHPGGRSTPTVMYGRGMISATALPIAVSRYRRFGWTTPADDACGLHHIGRAVKVRGDGYKDLEVLASSQTPTPTRQRHYDGPVSASHIRVLGLAGSLSYAFFIAWLYATGPATMAEVTGGVAASF